MVNIFAISSNPIECARALDDKRVNKILLECVQVMCTHLNGKGYTTPYKSNHKNHPITKWAGESSDNLAWLFHYGRALHNEFQYRYGHTHKSGLVLEALRPYIKKWSQPPKRFQNCARNLNVGLDYTHLPTHEAYRQYLAYKWNNLDRKPRWTNRGHPTWYTPKPKRKLVFRRAKC